MSTLFGTLADDFAPEAPAAETPFRIAVLGNFSGRSDRRLLKIDRENFDTVLGKLGPRVGIPVEDETAIVRFAALDEFHPDEIVDKVAQFEDHGDEGKGELMRAVLHHADFQELESAWRGLDWLLRRALKGTAVEVYLCDLSFEELTKDLTAADDLKASGLYQALVEKSSRGPKAAPWGLLVGLYLFDQTAAHADLLGRLAQLARRCAAPFLAGLAPRAVARGAAPAANALPTWTALRQMPEASMLGLAAPRFLLRQPYGADTKSIDKFEFEEFHGLKQDKPYLWGNAVLAVAALLAQAFQKQGWSFQPGPLTDLGGMALHAFTEDDEQQVTLAESWLTRAESEALAKQGIMPLLCVKGRDAVQLACYHALAEPAKGQPPVALVGQWGQEGMVRLPERGAPVGVKVGMGMPTSTKEETAKAPPPAKAAPAAPRAAEAPSPAPAPAPAETDEDAEMAALMAQLGGAEEAPPEKPAEAPAAAAEEEDPELAELMKQLGGDEEK